MTGLESLKTGDFNSMEQIGRVGDEVTIILSKLGERMTYQFRVKDLYGPNEKVLWEKIID